MLPLGLIVFTLLGCNQPPSANQVINPVEEENIPQEENSTPPIATNNQVSTAPQTRNTSSQIARAETTNQIQSTLPQKVEPTKRVETTPKQKTLPKIAQKNNSSSKYATVEKLKELDEKIRKRNGRIIGSASCDGDGKENDYRVDFDGDGMPDECISANYKTHPLIQEESVDSVNSTLNSLEKGSQVTSRKEGNFTYYLWRKNGKVTKAIKSDNKNLTNSVNYWFMEGKPIAVFETDSSNGSQISNTYYVYYQNGELSSIFELFGPEMLNSRRILEFNNQQLQKARSLKDGYKEIFNVFGAD